MIDPVVLRFDDGSIDLVCHELEGVEALGVSSRFDLVAHSREPVDAAKVVGTQCTIVLLGFGGAREVVGVVTRIGAMATIDDDVGRRYRLTVRSHLAVLEHRQQTTVYQHLSAPDIIGAVMNSAGLPADMLVVDTKHTHRVRDYVVQYAETDAAFIRRMCEEDGLFFVFEPLDGKAKLMLRDSLDRDPKVSAPFLVTGHNLLETALQARNLLVRRRRRPGKVTLRDYDPAHPQLALEGEATSGSPLEMSTEVYAAPGRFKTNKDGADRAKVVLDAYRSDSATISFETNALLLGPGDVLTLRVGADFTGPPPAEGNYAVVTTTHSWSRTHRYEMRVEAVASTLDFALPLVTPRPRAYGVHTARVTGAKGEEIHPDKDGSVFVKFHWDRYGPNDEKSSLPVRVAQPNTPGSMAIPRVDWEVFVMFEDGDPNRPYVMGRTYNAKAPPPFSLPKNKTVTSVATHSSPGGKGINSINFDDAAGRQHFAINAAFAKHTTVANNMLTQTSKVEEKKVKGSQSWTISGKEGVYVSQAYFVGVGSQNATVAAVQKIFAKGHMSISCASETVSVGAALLEKVGDPVQGAKNLAVSAALAGVGQLGLAGTVLSAAGGAAWAYHEASGQGGNAGRNAALSSLLGGAAGLVPGAGAGLASANSLGVRMPWDDPPPPPGQQAAGGGSTGAKSDSAAAAGPGPGHRNTIVKGSMMELIGGNYSVTTPGGINWQTTGGSVIKVSGSHNTKALSVATTVLGASTEKLGSLHIDCKGKVERTARAAITSIINGDLTANAGGTYDLKAKSSLTIKVGGSLTMSGNHIVFKVKGSVLASSPSGVYIHAGTIKVTDLSKQSSKSIHQ